MKVHVFINAMKLDCVLAVPESIYKTVLSRWLETTIYYLLDQ